MRRIIIVYNPRSSGFRLVQDEVLAVVRKLKGWMVAKYEVKPSSIEENAAQLAKILLDQDLVVVAGGDGTATIAANAAMLSEKDVVLGVLGYGNFNDMAKMLGAKRPKRHGDEYHGGVTSIIEGMEAGKVVELWPLEVTVNKKRWRYAPCYVTIGLFAESTEVFDEIKVRKKLQSRHRTPVFSWWSLAKWYFKNRKCREFIPAFKLNGEKMSKKITDYVAMNSPKMAGVMRGKTWYLDKKVFAGGTAGLRSFWKLFMLMLKSILWRVPIEETKCDVLEFEKPAEMEIQSEGEYMRLKAVSKIEIRKAKRCLKVVKL